MLSRIVTILLFVFLFLHDSHAQTTCTTLGQNPSTAFPVCGISTFFQTTVPICGGRQVPSICPVLFNYLPFTDKNPFWYKFTCYVSGTLGFIIKPKTLAEDYDWQLYDVTNRNPDDVFFDSTMVVGCNWSGEFGVTGAAPPPLGNSLVECEGAGVPLFSDTPPLLAGHNYLLLVSHYSNSQSGYSLTFGGGTAVITDPNAPHLQNANAACDGNSVTVSLNKKMRCSSLSADGSEFSIAPPPGQIVSATGIGCTNGFDMDSVRINFGSQLPAGNYTITIHDGNDGNTLVDYCDLSVSQGELKTFSIAPYFAAMDSIAIPGCAPDVLRVVFKNGIRCSSIAADGSDFIVLGPAPAAVKAAVGICNNGFATVIDVQLSKPITTKGIFAVKLAAGNDGNTLLNECFFQTPAGSMLNFVTSDTVNAEFSYTVECKKNNSVHYFHNGNNEVNIWKWNFDNVRTSGLQNPFITYTILGQKQTQLIVSNGVCSDTSAFVPIFLGNVLKAKFEATSIICPGDLANFTNQCLGNVISWNWDFGNGINSTAKLPPPEAYRVPAVNTDVPVKLTIKDGFGCLDSAVQTITVASTCNIAVPGAFTPNNDGINDYLYPLNAYKAIDLLFRVYDRFGQLVFETTNFLKRWDGRVRGRDADMGTYVWILHYTNPDTGKHVEQKGTTILIR